MSREHRDALLSELLPMARELLERTGDFYPFAGAVSPNGEVKLIAGSGTGKSKSMESVEVIAVGLAKGVRDGEYLATGICFTTRDPQSSEAICIEFEDADEAPAAIMVPYARRQKVIEFADMILCRCQGRVFPRNEKRIQP